jgi:hypothetical protein
MELRNAHPKIRRTLYAFNVAIPALVIVSHFFGAAIARLTAIG